MLRRAQFDALCGGLCGNERPQVVAQGIRLGRFTVKQPQRYCLLRITPPAHPQPLAVAWMQRAEETGLFGPLALAASDPLPAELRQFRHCFQAALNGVKTDWRHWLGKGPGLTPSHDDTLSGMLLAAWYYGASVGGFQPDFIGVCGRDGRAGGVLSIGADRRLCRDCDAGASDTSGRP